ncbi:MAG: hypothetical protein PHR62_06085 [Paludibacter sp.]|jgi:hypothetical protein|nr:hypothetical protein [Paludibacter sp.]
MANIDFNAVIETLKNEVGKLALDTIDNYAEAAKADGLKLLKSLENDIKTWGIQLVEGKLAADDVEFLIMGKKEIIEMNALKQAGLGMVKADEFKNSLLQLVVKTVIGLI